MAQLPHTKAKTEWYGLRAISFMTIECSQNVRGACILLYGKEIEEKLA